MATIKKVAKKGTSKFQQILAASGQGLLDRRAELIVGQTENALDNKVRTLQAERDKLEYEVLDLTDLSVKNNNSLRPGSDKYDADEFIGKLAELKAKIKDIDEDLEIYQEIQDEFFTVEEAAQEAK